MRNVTILLAVAALVGLAGEALALNYYWDDDSGNHQWLTPENWDPDGLPAPYSSYAYVNNGGTAQINGAAQAKGLLLGSPSGTSGTTELVTGSLYTYYGVTVGEYGTGTFNQYAGDADHSAITIGRYTGSAGSTYTMSGGVLASRGAVTVTNGIFHVKGSWVVAGQTEITFDSLTQDGTLQCSIGNPGITDIVVTNAATFGADSILDMGWDGIDPVAGIWPLLTAGSTVNKDNLQLHPDDVFNGSEGWFIRWDVGGKTLSAEYVPEPATMVLLGVGLIGAVLRRRRG